MSQEIRTYDAMPPSMPQNQPIQSGTQMNAGTVMTEQSRAVAEALGKMQVAKQFPRDENMAYSKIMQACSRPAFAKTALYSYPKGGQQVSGPSIRMAEMMIRAWGNCETGLKELSQRGGESEMMAYSWDYESNTMFVKNFTIKHERKARGSTTKLTDQRDIYELTANNGSRRQRATMLAAIPDYIVEDAVEQVKRTIAGSNDEPISDRIRKMVAAFGKLGVKSEHLAKYVGHDVDMIDADELVDLMGVYNSIKSGDFKASQYFSDMKKEEPSAAVADAQQTVGAPPSKPSTAQQTTDNRSDI